jgi:L-seryl-tRNA(Ser) seleniumtransferase
MVDTTAERAAALRNLPAVERLLQSPELVGEPRALVARCARAMLDDARTQVLAGELDGAALAARFGGDGAVQELRRRIASARERRHRRVCNATGIVLHTGLGRAPLCELAKEAIVEAAGYAVVEVDPGTGQRDQRELAIAALLRELTGAAGALVVNNNASATTLALGALCSGLEVVVSRGELVEIGGGFRIPDVMKRAGCHMVEVGATNKTHLHDFENAITAQTRAFLKVHPSNFRIEGFAGVPPLHELTKLAHSRGLIVIDDLGSGLLVNAPLPGLDGEPRVEQSLAAGADVVCFSGDKLLGGPQCGVLLGGKDKIATMRAHPLYRALRCDKLTLAALEATLQTYRDGEPLREIPALHMLSATPDELQRRSEDLAALLPAGIATVVASESFAGSGANPAKPLPSFAVALRGGDALLTRLRATRPVAVFARVHGGHVLLDARTLLLEDLNALAAIVRGAISSS